MKRRDAIKGAGVAAAAMALPGAAMAETMGMQPHKDNTGYFNFKVGTTEFLSVTDGHALFGPVQPTFAPLAKPDEIKKVLADNFLPTDKVDVAFNVLLVKNGNQNILFDTGCGVLFGPDSGKLPENLRKAGVPPEAIDTIILTHAHPDHVGGLLDAQGQQVFKNAAIYIAQAEYDFWTTSKPDMSKSQGDATSSGQLVAVAAKFLGAVKDQLKFYKDGDTLFGLFEVEVLKGHTPGHTLSHFRTGSGGLVHMGDISHNHALLLEHPEWGVTFDTDFKLAGKERRATLETLAVNKSRVFSCHLPWPGIGFIRKKGEGFEWVAQPFSTSQFNA